MARSDVSATSSASTTTASVGHTEAKPFSFVDRDLAWNRARVEMANREQTESTRNVAEFTKMLRSYPSNEAVVSMMWLLLIIFFVVELVQFRRTRLDLQAAQASPRCSPSASTRGP